MCTDKIGICGWMDGTVQYMGTPKALGPVATGGAALGQREGPPTENEIINRNKPLCI